MVQLVWMKSHWCILNSVAQVTTSLCIKYLGNFHNSESYLICLHTQRPIVYSVTFLSATDETDRGKEEGNHNSQGPVVAISIGTVLVCVLVCGSAVVVLVMVRRYHNHSKSTHALDAAGLQTRNVVYDEVALSPTTTPSSVIPTEPNTAYVTTTIPTDQNVAYAVHSLS
ncbi:hypothetical protein GBAR_LOCUS5345 [Geodia barretti]|uniref:Uncharacterized protein n=1 Tax=Geodia barretti TaxID=519541 RepID=A0AA35RA74_GEOBA|nr:hypothetical protein GBAR_LOCUS5345 [Geodia barretti]